LPWSRAKARVATGSMENECTFSTFAFMKDKSCNLSGPHLDMTIHMFAQEFFTQKNFVYHEAITNLKYQKM
jgi:hypothetical protein